MKNINKTITAELGKHLKCNIIFEKESVKLNTSISLSTLKANNSINLDLLLTRNPITSPINFGNYLIPSFFKIYETVSHNDSEILKIKDAYNNEQNFYLTLFNQYFNFDGNIKLEKINTVVPSFKYYLDDSNSIVVSNFPSLENNSYIVSRFKDQIRFILTNDGIFEYENYAIKADGKRVVFERNPSNSIINRIYIYDGYYSSLSGSKREVIDLSYSNDGRISDIIINHIDGTKDTYNFTFYDNEWQFHHYESKRTLYFKFDSEGNVISFKDDFNDSIREDFYNNITITQNYTIIHKANNEFLYFHFNNEGNFDYAFNNNGVIQAVESYSYEADYFISKESDPLYLKHGNCKYANLAPIYMISLLSKWNFYPGSSNSKMTFISNNNIEYFSVFNTSLRTTISIDETDNNSYLEANVEGDFTNKSFVFSSFINTKYSGSAELFIIKFIPFYNNTQSGEPITRIINLNEYDSYRYILENVFFKVMVDKINIQILFRHEQIIEFYNIMFFEHDYGTINFYDSKNLLYKKIKGNNVERYKRYDFELKSIDLYGTNIFVEEDEELESGYKQTVTVNSNVKKIIERDFSNNVLNEKIIYNTPGYNEVKETKFIYNEKNLNIEKIYYNIVEEHYTYYLNTTDLQEVSCFDVTQITSYENFTITSTFYKDDNLVNYIYKTEFSYDIEGKIVSIKEDTKTPFYFEYNYFGDTTNINLGNNLLETNIYEESDNYPQTLLINKTLNGTNYSLNYDDKDRIISIFAGQSVISSFTYDYLGNVITINEGDDYSKTFIYDADNRLIEENCNNYGIKNNIFGNNLISKSYLKNNTVEKDIISNKSQNFVSVAIKNTLDKLADSNRYTALFDRTNTYLKKTNDKQIENDYYNNILRYCTLIKNYYSDNEFLEPTLLKSKFEEGPILLEGKYKYSLKILSINSLYYEKLIHNQYGTISGSFGGCFLNLNDSSNIPFSIHIEDLYKIKLILVNETNTSRKQIKIQLTNLSDYIIANFSTNFFIDDGEIASTHLNFSLTQTQLKLNLFYNQQSQNCVFGINSTLKLSTTIKYYLEEDTKQFTYYTRYYGLLADFGVNIPIEEVNEFYSSLNRTIQMDNVFSLEDSYAPTKIYSSIYNNIDSSITWLPLKLSFVDNKGNYPLNYKDPTGLFVFDNELKTDSYYGFNEPLLYKTNLGSEGYISFKAKVLSIKTNEQTYLTLFNENLKIRLFIDELNRFCVSFNNVTNVLFENPLLLQKYHFIFFKYKINANNITYEITFNSNIYMNVVNVSTNILSFPNFNLLLAGNSEEVSIQDYNSNIAKYYTDTFNGCIFDVNYKNGTIENNVKTEVFKSFKYINHNTDYDIFERINKSALSYKEINILNKRYVYEGNENGSFTPYLKEERIYFKNSDPSYDVTMDRKYSYSFENAAEPQLNYKNIYSYSEEIGFVAMFSNERIVHKYEYFAGTNFIKSEVIEKYLTNENDEEQLVKTWRYDFTYSNLNLVKVENRIDNILVKNNTFICDNNTNKITQFNNRFFVYDGLYLKQIKSYTGQVEQEFYYQGTKLTNYIHNVDNKNFSFKYDFSGKRISKTDNNTNQTIFYLYDEDKLIKEIHSEFELSFIYSGQDELIGFTYKNLVNSMVANYFYLKNAFNDVVEILDENGNSVVHYIYNAFGEIVLITDTSNSNIANINPFRYRGYYYDAETDYFWLSSRYYSSELCRFICPDDVGYLDPIYINGLNLYCYCLNNPIMYVDPSGHEAIAAGFITLVYYALIALLAMCAISTIAYIESKTHFIENSLTSLKNAITDFVEYVSLEITVLFTSEITYSGNIIADSRELIPLSNLTISNNLDNFYYYKRKKAAPRIRSNSKKRAREKAFLKGGKVTPIHHPNGKYGPHFHPKDPRFSHWHYYYLWLLLFREYEE